MSYRITYGPRKRKRWIFWVLAAGMLAVAVLIPRETLERWLLPGDTQVTKAALAQMLESLRQGTPAGEAVVTFCQSIVWGASGG